MKSYGYVAECLSVNKPVLADICKLAIPVIAPIGINHENGQKYNINADSLAYKIAERNECRFIFSRYSGVLIEDEVKSELSIQEINTYIETTEIYEHDTKGEWCCIGY